MRKKTAALSSLKNRISLRLKYDKNASHACLAHLALIVVISGLIALCGVNTFLDNNVPLQSVVSATFCISAGLLYAVYMIISRLLALVLNYAERHSKHSYYDFTIESGGDDDEGSTDDQPKKSYFHKQNKKNYTSEYDDSTSTNTSSDEDSEKNVKKYFIQKKKRHIVQSKRLPRNVVISSMYLGGSGAFLAIPALCMWDFTISAFFIGSMTILSIIDFGKIVSEFQPNVDTGSAVTNLKAIRYASHLAIIATISSVIFLDSIMSEQSVIFTNEGLANSHASNNNSKHWGSEIGVGLFLRWPLVLLAASSPVLLRAGGGGVGPFMHSLPPSQTLETGLPVSILLAILVICWYSPLESSLLLPSMVQFKDIHLPTFLPMIILGPSLVSATLAFVLRGFRNRSACTTAIILTCALVVRQQINPLHRLSSHKDCVAILLCLVMISIHVCFVVYKRRVELIPSAVTGPIKFTKKGKNENKNIPDSDVLDASGDDYDDNSIINEPAAEANNESYVQGDDKLANIVVIDEEDN